MRIKRNDPKDKAGEWDKRWKEHAPTEVVRKVEAYHATNGGEYAFAWEAKGRRWSFDWCLPMMRIAVEIDGGKWITRRTKGGRIVPVGHNRQKDNEKMNTAAELGWLVFHYTPRQLQTSAKECVEQVLRALCLRVDELIAITAGEQQRCQNNNQVS